MTHWTIRCAHFRKIITQVIFFCELQRLPPTEEKDLFFRGTLPDITTANRHDSVVLHCKVGGREPTIHWLKDGVRIQQVRDIELIWAQHSGWKFSLKSNFIFKKKLFFYFNFLCVLSVLKQIYFKKISFYHFQGESRDYRNDQAQYEDTAAVTGKSFTASKLYLDCVDEASEGVYTCIGETPTERITQSTNLVLSKFKIDLNYSDFYFFFY